MAFYDTKPSKFEAVGNGSYVYRWNIQEVEAPAQQEGEQRTQWQCEEVIIWAPVTANKITEAVIEHTCPSSREQKLVNEYNGANLGVYGAKTSEAARAKIAAYTEFLTERKALKEMVDADCAELGIL